MCRRLHVYGVFSACVEAHQDGTLKVETTNFSFILPSSDYHAAGSAVKRFNRVLKEYITGLYENDYTFHDHPAMGAVIIKARKGNARAVIKASLDGTVKAEYSVVSSMSQYRSHTHELERVVKLAYRGFTVSDVKVERGRVRILVESRGDPATTLRRLVELGELITYKARGMWPLPEDKVLMGEATLRVVGRSFFLPDISDEELVYRYNEEVGADTATVSEVFRDAVLRGFNPFRTIATTPLYFSSFRDRAEAEVHDAIVEHGLATPDYYRRLPHPSIVSYTKYGKHPVPAEYAVESLSGTLYLESYLEHAPPYELARILTVPRLRKHVSPEQVEYIFKRLSRDSTPHLTVVAVTAYPDTIVERPELLELRSLEGMPIGVYSGVKFMVYTMYKPDKDEEKEFAVLVPAARGKLIPYPVRGKTVDSAASSVTEEGVRSYFEPLHRLLDNAGDTLKVKLHGRKLVHAVTIEFKDVYGEWNNITVSTIRPVSWASTERFIRRYWAGREDVESIRRHLQHL